MACLGMHEPGDEERVRPLSPRADDIIYRGDVCANGQAINDGRVCDRVKERLESGDVVCGTRPLQAEPERQENVLAAGMPIIDEILRKLFMKIRIIHV